MNIPRYRPLAPGVREILAEDLQVGDAIEVCGKAHRVDGFAPLHPSTVAALADAEGGRCVISEGQRFMVVFPGDRVRVYGEG